MAYRFKLDEPISKGFKRIAREHISRALNELGEGDVAADAVHESRKTIKRLRALLRLVRPEIAEKAFKARSAGLRNAGHMLSGQRESKVLSDTIAKLEAQFGEDGARILTPFKLAAANALRASNTTLDNDAATTLRALLETEGRRLEKLKLRKDGLQVLATGLAQSYGKGRRALAKAYKSPSDVHFHDLRKTVQWHWRHMALLSRAWPEYFEVRINAARELSQLLGDDHDLAMLQLTAEDLHKTESTDFAPVIRLARARQEELRADCFERARRLFAERPEDFVRRIEIYWSAGQRVKPLQGPIDHDTAHLEPPSEPRTASSAPRLTVAKRDNVPSQRRA